MRMSKKLLWSIYGLFFVAGIAQAAIVPLLPRLSAEYGLAASETGLLLALPGLATLAVSVPAGIAADRLGARRCTLLAGVVLCVSSLAEAAPSLPALLVGRLLFGVAYGVLWTTGAAWLAELDTEPGASRIGPSVTCASVGMMVGPAVGGLVAGAGATGLPFLLIAILSAVMMVPLTIAGTRAAGARAAGARAAGARAAGARAAGARAAGARAAGAHAAGAHAAGAHAAGAHAAGARAAAAARARAADRAGADTDEPVELARAVGYSDSVELARAVGYSDSVELASSVGYGEPMPYGGGRASTIRTALQRPGVVAAMGALVVSGAVSSVSQLLISGALQHDGLSGGRIGLAFSLAAVSYIAVSLAVVRLGARVRTLRFNALATAAMAVVLVPGLLSGSATVLIATLMVASMPRAVVSTISYSLASASSEANGGAGDSSADGSVFGAINGAWAGSLVLMPLLAGALEQHGGARVGYLAVIVPATLIATALLAGSRTRTIAAHATIAS
jgi:MFS family permease